jgi:hypothetical protein
MTETSDQILKRPAKESWFSRFQVVALAALTLIAVVVLLPAAMDQSPLLSPISSLVHRPILNRRGGQQ